MGSRAPGLTPKGGVPPNPSIFISRSGLDWTGLDHLHCWRSMTWLSDTIVLHSSRSCDILVHSATDDPIQSLMSSIHRLLGRPRRFLPLIQPWRTAVHTLSALAVCPKKLQFPSLDVLQKSRFFSNFFQNELVCSVLFPADPQHASIWRHFKGANPFPVGHQIGLKSKWNNEPSLQSIKMILSSCRTFAIWLLGVWPPTKRGPPTKPFNFYFAPGLPPVKSGPGSISYHDTTPTETAATMSWLHPRRSCSSFSLQYPRRRFFLPVKQSPVLNRSLLFQWVIAP